MVIGTALDMGGGMFDALNSLRKAIEASGDKLQKASLALGKTFDQTNAEITPAMEGLRGSLDQRVGAAIAGLEAGLQGNTAGVAKLINQQQLTGTAFGNTANVMASLSQSLNVNNADINSLSENLIETAGTYSVSTDKLVNAVDALKDTFPTQQLAGMGTQVTEAMMSLTAQMPAMAGQVTSVMKTILDPSLKTEANLARLGIAGVRERLTAAKDAKSAEAILIDAIRTAGGNITNFVSGDFFASIGIATSVFGENAAAMAAINNQLDKRIKNEERAMDFGDTIKAIRDSVLVPLQRVLQTDFYPAIKQISKVLSGIGERFADVLAKWIGKLDISEKSVLGFTDMLVNGAVSLSKGLQGFGNAMLEFTNTAVPQIKNAFNAMSNGVRSIAAMLDALTDPVTLARFAARMSGPLGFAADKAAFGDLNLFGDFERARTDHKKTEFERFTFAEEGSTLILALKDLHSSSETVARNTARTADATEAVNNKTLDPFGDTADSYLANTAMQMQSIMGSILGQTPQDQLEETNNILQAILGTSQNRGFNSSTPSLGLGR
jgi:hypothetical protein